VRPPWCCHLACHLPCSSAPLQSLTATASPPMTAPGMVDTNTRLVSLIIGIFHLPAMSTTRMFTDVPDAFRHEDGANPEWDGGHERLLPWGSVPFGGMSAGDRSTALPRPYRPLSGFHTPSAVYSHPSLVALFHATSAHRISVFRAFPSSPAAISFDIQCSLAVSPASASAQRTGHPRWPPPSVICLAVHPRGASPGFHCAPL